MERIEKIFGAGLPDYKDLLEQNLSLRRVVSDLTSMLSKKEQELHDLVPSLNDFQLVFEAKIDTIIEDCIHYSANMPTNNVFYQSSWKEISSQLQDLKTQEKRIFTKVLESEEHYKILFDTSLDYSKSCFSPEHDNSNYQQRDRSVYFDTYNTSDLNVSDIPKADNRRDSIDESGYGASVGLVEVPMNSTRLEKKSPLLPTVSHRPVGKNVGNEKLGSESEKNNNKTEKKLEHLLSLINELRNDIEGLKTTNLGLSENVEEALGVGQNILDRINFFQPKKEKSSAGTTDDAADVAEKATSTSTKRRPNPKIVILKEGSDKKQEGNSRRRKERVSSTETASNSTRARSPSCPCKGGCRTRSCTCRENLQSCDDCDCDPLFCTNRSSDEQASLQSAKSSNNSAKLNKNKSH